jgi:hypothetical protein
MILKAMVKRKSAWDWATTKLGVSSMFFMDMVKDDDWKFLIKWAAILETSINELLATHLNDQSLMEVIGDLPMHGRSSKMAFVRTCNLLPEGAQDFLTKMAAMRNHAVHSIRNFNFTFEGYAKSKVPKHEFAQWRDVISYGLPGLYLTMKPAKPKNPGDEPVDPVTVRIRFTSACNAVLQDCCDYVRQT